MNFLDISNYTILQSIGNGAFSNVYRVKDQTTGKIYAAKVSLFIVDEDTQATPETLAMFREINLISLFNHPSILKFIGYSQQNFEQEMNPTIVTEYAPNGSLQNIIEMEKLGLSPKEWNLTKKLITIYGIASGMSYMHSHNVIHRDLKAENILIDEYLHPKISDFGLSKITDILSMSMNFVSQKGLKGTPIYMAPEILSNELYSKASDVYAFAFIVFEIFALEKPFIASNIMAIIKKVCDGFRPSIPDDIPDCYKNLIERCWSQEPEKRPSFDEIVQEIQDGDDFINDLIDEPEFLDYVDFINSYNSSFLSSNKLMHFHEFITKQGRNKNIAKVNLNDDDEILDKNQSSTDEKMAEISPNIERSKLENQSNEEKLQLNVQEDQTMKIKEDQQVNASNDQPLKIKEDQPTNEQKDQTQEKQLANTQIANDQKSTNNFLNFYENLNETCQMIIYEALEKQPLQIIVAKSLINGENGFPQNIYYGKGFLQTSLKNVDSNNAIYFIELLIKGEIFPRNLKFAKSLMHYVIINDQYLSYLKGLIYKKTKKYSKAFKSFENGAKNGNTNCMYELGKILLVGQGCLKNKKKAFYFFNMASEKGFTKSANFITVYNQMMKFNEFQKLNEKAKILFITNSFKNNSNNFNPKNGIEFNQLVIKSEQTEMLYFDNSFKSTSFHSFLSKYKEITIFIKYYTPSSDKIYRLISQMKSKAANRINIGITTLLNHDNDIQLITKDFSCASIDTSLFEFECINRDKEVEFSFDVSIKENAFKGFSSIKQITIPSSVTSISDSAFEDFKSLEKILIPSSVVSIGKMAFKGCSSIKQIQIPPSVIMILANAFDECKSLEQIVIPFSVTTIGEMAFYRCSSIKQMQIPSYVTSIGDNTFEKCTSLEQLTIPPNVTTIGLYAFRECSSLKQITIPFSVTKIKDCVFQDCISLKEVIFSNPSPITGLEKNYFTDNKLLTKIELPSSLAMIPFNFCNGCESLSTIIIYPSVKTIGYFAFYGCSSLAEISIPSSVTSIGDRSFSECISLIQISIPSSVLSIGESVFNGCSSLKQISFSNPSSVNYIGDCAFERCTSLTQLEIPSFVSIIGNFLFNGCISLTKVVIPSSVKSIGECAFNMCKSLKHVSIPSSIRKIGNCAFDGCVLLEESGALNELKIKIIE